MRNWKVARIFSTPSLNVNGTLSWILMELPSPITLLVSFNQVYPLQDVFRFSDTRTFAPVVLVGFYLLHYANRAVVSPLRTASRSPTHIIVLITSVVFNLFNGFLIGTYLGSLAKFAAGSPPSFSLDPSFWIYIGAAFMGWASNVWHDEVLLKMRKKKDNPRSSSPSPSPPAENNEQSPLRESNQSKGDSGRYSIPFGGLYRFISYVILYLRSKTLCSYWLGHPFADIQTTSQSGTTLISVD